MDLWVKFPSSMHKIAGTFKVKIENGYADWTIKTAETS